MRVVRVPAPRLDRASRRSKQGHASAAARTIRGPDTNSNGKEQERKGEKSMSEGSESDEVTEREDEQPSAPEQAEAEQRRQEESGQEAPA